MNQEVECVGSLFIIILICVCLFVCLFVFFLSFFLSILPSFYLIFFPNHTLILTLGFICFSLVQVTGTQMLATTPTLSPSDNTTAIINLTSNGKKQSGLRQRRMLRSWAHFRNFIVLSLRCLQLHLALHRFSLSV